MGCREENRVRLGLAACKANTLSLFYPSGPSCLVCRTKTHQVRATVEGTSGGAGESCPVGEEWKQLEFSNSDLTRPKVPSVNTPNTHIGFPVFPPRPGCIWVLAPSPRPSAQYLGRTCQTQAVFAPEQITQKGRDYSKRPSSWTFPLPAQTEPCGWVGGCNTEQDWAGQVLLP